eukprot:g10414.t1
MPGATRVARPAALIGVTRRAQRKRNGRHISRNTPARPDRVLGEGRPGRGAISVGSPLGRPGASASPRLPGATTDVINEGLLTYKLADGITGHAAVDTRNVFEGRWGPGSGLGGHVDGRGGGGEGRGGKGKDGRPVVKPTGAAGVLKSWLGSSDTDIIGE